MFLDWTVAVKHKVTRDRYSSSSSFTKELLSDNPM